MAIARIVAPKLVYKGRIGKRGPLAIPVPLDFVTAQTWIIDLTSPELQNSFEALQTIYIDNSANTQQLYITCGTTSQILVVPPNSCAYLPVLQPNPSQLEINSTGSISLVIQLLNFHVEPIVWSTQAINSASSGGVTGCRLTPITNTPLLPGNSNITGVTTDFFSPYVGNTTLMWNGTSFDAVAHAELSQALSDNTKSPAAATANHNYDKFVWLDNGVPRCTRNANWSSDFVRGAANAIVRQNGILVNQNAITNGPAAGFGTYVGTIHTDGSNQLDMQFEPPGAAGGTQNKLCLWNMYNQVPLHAVNFDNTVSWNYTTATWRTKNNNGLNSTLWIQGLNGVLVKCRNMMTAQSSNAAGAAIGWGLGGVVAPFGAVQWLADTTAKKTSAFIEIETPLGEGWQVATPIEISIASGTTTWFGNTTAGSVDVISKTICSLMG